MSLSKEEYEKEKLKRIRWAIEQQKKRDANTSIKKGKKVIDNISLNNKSKTGQQTHGRANKAGTGLNSQDGKKKTREDRKLENRTEQDEKNEKASLLVNFQDKNSIELVKTFNDTDVIKNKEIKKNPKKKKISKREQIIIDNNQRILDKAIAEEKRIISKISDCSTFEEAYYYYRSMKHCQVLYLFTTLKWCYDKYIKNLKGTSSSNKALLKKLLLKIKIILLHIQDRDVVHIEDELMKIFEECKKLTEEMESIELQLKGDILPKPMNDFKESLMKADLWQVNVIDLINKKNNVLVCAPTSTGKTIIGTYMASRKGRTLFLVPNESVAIQVTGVVMNFSDGNYTVQTSNFTIENNSATMIIGTPIEVENYIIKTNNYEFENIIIDEIHCLNNNDTPEEIEYANSIKRLMLVLSGQFLFLSATLTDKSMNNLKTYIEMIKDKECQVIKHTERFINLQFRIMNTNLGIDSVNPFSQIDLSEINDFKGKNMSITNNDIWNFWQSCIDEDEFLPQMKKWLGDGLLDLNTIQKVSSKIPKFIQSQIEDDPEFIQEVLEEVGSNIEILELDMNNKNQLNEVLFKLIKELKTKDLLPGIIFQNNIVDCYEIHSRIVDILEEKQDEEYPNFYEEKKQKAKEFYKIQSKIDKMQESSSKIKASSKQDRDSAHKAQEQKREAQKEQISNMTELQYGIDLNIHAPHPDYSCGITQISDDSMREVRWTMHLKTAAYDTTFMKGIQRGIGIYTSDMPSINQHVMRGLIQNKNVGLLIADNSLAYGVNLPIRTVIVLDDGNVSSQTILQQIGRAGRRGLDTQGTVLIIKVKNATGKNPIKEILMAKFPTIEPELDKNYFSFTEMIKPFCIFETKKKADNYLRLLNDTIAKKEISLIKNSIDEKFIMMMRTVFKNNDSEIIEYLTKTMWLIETYKVNNPINAKFLCYIPYNMNQNISSIKLYILMPFLNEKFGSLTGVSHTENRYLFRIMVWLYDIGEKTEEIDEEILDVINESGFNDVFGISNNSSYASDIYEHFIHNNVPENQKLMIEMKFRLQTIYDILKSIHKMIDETEFKNIKTLITNVMNKVDKMIKKSQIL
jgi:superfamily II RNA helicase